MKTTTIATMAVFSCLFCMTTYGVQKSELSPLLKQLLPAGDVVKLKLTNGRVIEGEIRKETPGEIVFKMFRPGGIPMTKTIKKIYISGRQETDVGNALAEKLVKYRVNPNHVLEKDQYLRALTLLSEFLEKCKGQGNHGQIQVIHDEFAAELANINKGLDKIGGEWFSPVSGAIRWFEVYTEEIEKAVAHENRNTQKMKDYIEEREELRNKVLQDLPAVLRDTIPKLLKRKEFDTAVEEMTAFIHFWLGDVLDTVGGEKNGLREMDYSQIQGLQDKVIAAYQAAGLGNKVEKSRDKDMVYVPGGYFLMGSRTDNPADAAFPLRIVWVDPYLIDKYEVTNEDYRKFVEYTKTTEVPAKEHPKAPPMKDHSAEGWNATHGSSLGGDKQPVVGVDWFDAWAYAEWKGKRLPTEAEWEKAARGVEERIFPWGDKDEKVSINIDIARKMLAKEMDAQKMPEVPETQGGGCGCVEQAEPEPVPPTRLPSTTWGVDDHLPPQVVSAIEQEEFEWKNTEFFSPYGCMHMAGNAAEWVFDYYDKEHYKVGKIKNPQGSEEGTLHVLRGGSYLNKNNSYIKTFVRSRPANGKEASGVDRHGKPYVGFRCVKSL